MTYIETFDNNLFTHWIPTFDDKFDDLDPVTLLRPYKLFKSLFDGEICILDNTDQEVPLYLVHNGFFVKLTNDGVNEIYKRYDYDLGKILNQSEIDTIIVNLIKQSQ